jgi:hypothetical protein
MSAHPNVILMAVLTPDNTSRKTMREILAAAHPAMEPGSVNYDQVRIGDRDFDTLVMESEYDEGWQIGGEEGQIIVFDLLTYGYGEEIAWDELVRIKDELEAWAIDACAKHACSYRITVSANYW